MNNKEPKIMPLKLWEINPVIWGNENCFIITLYQSNEKIHLLVDDLTANKINAFLEKTYYEKPYPNIEKVDDK